MPEVRKVFTLVTGLNRLSTLLASVSSGITGIGMNLTHLKWTTITGGPISKGNGSMAAVADGDPYAINTGNSEEATATDRIDATQVYFFPTNNGDKLYIEARSA